MLQKLFISDKCCFGSFYSSKNPEKMYSTVLNIDSNDKKNVSWTVSQHIRMISEGSCDTEDWSNDAENSALHHRSKLHFKIYSNRKHLF